MPRMHGTQRILMGIAQSDGSFSPGNAIIHDPAKTVFLRESGTALPYYVATEYTAITDADIVVFPLPELPATAPEDFTVIHHSSGSVSGMPKVVPKTNKWLSTIQYKSAAFCIGDYEGQDIYVWTWVTWTHLFSFLDGLLANPSLMLSASVFYFSLISPVTLL